LIGSFVAPYAYQNYDRTVGEASEAARSLVQRRWSKPENVDRRVDALADRIRKLVAAAPPLTAEQVQRLRDLLPPVTEDKSA
jgi:hypothetical protein